MKPMLQPLEGEFFVHKTTTIEEEARIDIEANGFWDSRFCRTFFDAFFESTSYATIMPERYQRGIQVPRHTEDEI